MNSSYWCGQVHSHTVCAESEPGDYIIGLVLMPAGAKFSIRSAFDLDTVSLTKIE